MIKVTVGGQDVAMDLSRTLAQSGIRPGSTLKLKLTGLLGGMLGSCDFAAALCTAPAGLAHIFAPSRAPPPAGAAAAADKTAAAVDQQTSSADDAAASGASSPPVLESPPDHCAEPASAMPQDRTEAAEMRALRERVRALEQQLASTADEAPDPGKGPSDVHRSRVLGWLPPANDGNAQDELEPAMPHALMLALRGLDDAGLRREFNKHADKDKDTERRMSKAGLASFMRDKGLAHGDADVERAMERVDTNKDGDIDYAEFCSLSQADSDLEKVLQAKCIESILCYYFPKGKDTTLEKPDSVPLQHTQHACHCNTFIVSLYMCTPSIASLYMPLTPVHHGR